MLFGSDLVNLSVDVRERETEGKCSVSGDLKIYPANLLSMDRAVASLQQIQHSLITHGKLMMRLNNDNFKHGDNWNSERGLKPNMRERKITFNGFFCPKRLKVRDIIKPPCT